MRARWLRLGLTGLAVPLLVVALGFATPAQAHAYLVSSNPGDGSSVVAAPRQLRLGFSEHVVAEATKITVVDTTGRAIHVSGVHLVTGSPSDTEEPSSIVATWPALPRGAYRVSWETLSRDDLHRTAGVFAFGVGRPVHATLPSEPLPRADEALWRGGLLLGLALLLGGLLTQRLLRRSGGSGAAARVLAATGGLSALVSSAMLLISQLAGSGADPAAVLLSAYGVRWGVRALGLLALTGAVLRPPARGARLLVGAGVVTTCLATASLGHAGSGSISSTRLGADAAHLGATLTWGGAVICLACLVLVRRTSRRATRDLDVRAALHAFAVPAAACLSIAVVTGVYLTSSVVGSVDAALQTFYGRTLLLKLAVVGAAAGLGLVNHLRLRHGPGGLRVSRTVPTEAVLVVGVVLLTALLTSGQPATEPAYVGSSAVPDTALVDRQVGDLQISAGVRPNRPGSALAVADVFNSRRPEPAPITGVDVAVGRGAGAPAQSLGDGHWSVPVTLAGPGTTALHVTVHRAGLPDEVGAFTWTIGSAVPTPPAMVSRAPLGGWLRLAAGGGAAVLGVLWTVRGLGRRRARRALARPQAGLDRVRQPQHI